MTGMSNVPDITPEQLRMASQQMAGMSPEDMARTAEMAQSMQGRQPGNAPGAALCHSSASLCSALSAAQLAVHLLSLHFQLCNLGDVLHSERPRCALQRCLRSTLSAAHACRCSSNATQHTQHGR